MSDDLYLMRARDDAEKALRTAQTIGQLDVALQACRLAGVIKVRMDRDTDTVLTLPLSESYWYRRARIEALEALATA